MRLFLKPQFKSFWSVVKIRLEVSGQWRMTGAAVGQGKNSISAYIAVVSHRE